MTTGEAVYSSYVEAYLAASRGNSEAGTSRTSSAARARKLKSHIDGDPLPAKPISVLHRPSKPSAKNVEDLDTAHERDKAAFERRASGYRRLAQNKYHHHAPPGSILTTFEQGHIVDRGRGRSGAQEARGVYDPVTNTYRIAPAPDAPGQRPRSASASRGYADIHSSGGAVQAQEGAAASASPTGQERPASALEHKRLQVSRGTYNPLTHEYRDAPAPDYVSRKEKEFDRAHGLGNGMRRVQPVEAFDPITGAPKQSPAPPPPHAPAPTPDAHGSGPPLPAPGAAAEALEKQRPTSAPGRGGAARRSMSGPSWGTYNPILGEWQVPPADPRFAQQETLVERRLGVSGQSAGRTETPGRQGVYDPIRGEWKTPPADQRAVNGLAFAPATLFSRPTPATIRM